jgi:CBS domain-containing protein
MTNDPLDSTTLEETVAMVEKARDVMKIGVKTVSRESSIYEAIRILVEHRISGLPVMDGREMVGIITEKDLLRLVLDAEHTPGPVGDYMTREIVAFDEEDDLDEIRSCLVENSYRRVPILRDSELVGIITRADLIRAHAATLGLGSPRRSARHPDAEPLARDVMTPGLLTTTPDAPIDEAVDILLTHGLTGLPVVDDSMGLVGILSEKDVLRLPDSESVRTWRVQHVMTGDVTSFDMYDSLFDVCECLATNNFRRVPILHRGRLVGVVSRADLVVHLLKRRSILFERRHAVGPCAR